MPGLNVRVAFINLMHLTYEDAMVMSISCAQRFAYRRITAVVLPKAEGDTLSVGSVIYAQSKSYWPMPVNGTGLLLSSEELP